MHASKLSFLKVSSLSKLKEQHVRGHLSLVPVDGELGSSRACMGAEKEAASSAQHRRKGTQTQAGEVDPPREQGKAMQPSV